jgi:glycosyltransferase involved in cell wall biosynthesis
VPSDRKNKPLGLLQQSKLFVSFDPSVVRSRHHFLGKGAWPVKNLKGAIRVALAAGVEMDVLGAKRLGLSHQLRWTWSPRIHFHGMVGGDEKFRLLQQSKGLIFPVRWHEPFGLAVIESLYFGAPVYATPYGALPEIVTPEVGSLSDNMDGLVAAVTAGNFAPEACHERATQHFNHLQMGRGYVQYYERVLSGETLHPQQPVLLTNGRALKDWD